MVDCLPPSVDAVPATFIESRVSRKYLEGLAGPNTIGLTSGKMALSIDRDASTGCAIHVRVVFVDPKVEIAEGLSERCVRAVRAHEARHVADYGLVQTHVAEALKAGSALEAAASQAAVEMNRRNAAVDTFMEYESLGKVCER